jgi:hypothetical protein
MPNVTQDHNTTLSTGDASVVVLHDYAVSHFSLILDEHLHKNIEVGVAP